MDRLSLFLSFPARGLQLHFTQGLKSWPGGEGVGKGGETLMIPHYTHVTHACRLLTGITSTVLFKHYTNLRDQSDSVTYY